MRRILLPRNAALGAALSLLCAALAWGGGVPVATVGAAPISAEALAAAASRRGHSVETPEQRRALLEDLVRAKLVVEAARAEGYERNPAVLAALEAALASRFKEDRLAPRLGEAAVSDAEVAAYYEAHRAEFAVPPQVLAAVIRVSVPARAGEDVRAKARQRADAAREAALKLPAASRSFGSVAVTYSDDQLTRYRGGETGWFRADGKGRTGEMEPEAAKALEALAEPGAVSPVVATPSGFLLVKLMDRKPATTRPLARVSEEIRHRLLQGKVAAAEKAFYDALRAKIPVVVDEAALAAAPLPAPEKAGPPPALPR